MLFISFAWTTDAFLANQKTRTRRHWNDSYAERFIKAYHDDAIFGALNRLWRFGGKQIGYFWLTEEPFKQWTSQMTEDDYIKEGLQWMEQKKKTIQGKTARQFFEDWKKADDLVWVISFQKVEP